MLLFLKSSYSPAYSTPCQNLNLELLLDNNPMLPIIGSFGQMQQNWSASKLIANVRREKSNDNAGRVKSLKLLSHPLKLTRPESSQLP
jgi:hypothetical protein